MVGRGRGGGVGGDGGQGGGVVCGRMSITCEKI